jgi:hypothetical protein
VAWRKPAKDPFPGPLREFREEDWPPAEGECLGHYGGCDRWYGGATGCAPPGGPCGQPCYEKLAAGYPDRPEVLAAVLAADAFTRYHRARLNWLGEDHPGYVDEFIEGCRRDDEIRYAPFRESRS